MKRYYRLRIFSIIMHYNTYSIEKQSNYGFFSNLKYGVRSRILPDAFVYWGESQANAPLLALPFDSWADLFLCVCWPLARGEALL